jgi:hypothetical protein
MILYHSPVLQMPGAGAGLFPLFPLLPAGQQSVVRRGVTFNSRKADITQLRYNM